MGFDIVWSTTPSFKGLAWDPWPLSSFSFLPFSVERSIVGHHCVLETGNLSDFTGSQLGWSFCLRMNHTSRLTQTWFRGDFGFRGRTGIRLRLWGRWDGGEFTFHVRRTCTLGVQRVECYGLNCVPHQIQNDTECGPIWRPRLERGINGVMWLGPNPMGLVSL